MADTAVVAFADESAFMVMKYETTPSLMIVTVTTAPSGNVEPRDAAMASLKYYLNSASSAAVMVSPDVPTFVFPVMLTVDMAEAIPSVEPADLA